MRRIRRFKKGLTHSLFSKPKRKFDRNDVYAAHFMVASQVWAFAKK